MRRRAFITILGSIAAWPLAARAQRRTGRLHRLAVLASANSTAEMKASPHWQAFFDELLRLGYREGENLTVERRTAEGDARRFPDLARELVRLRPDVIYATSNRAVAALKAATQTIPIVAIVGDPVGAGFAASLARPGGNISGFSVEPGLEIMGKRIALLKEIVPTASRIAYLTARIWWEGRYGAIWREAARREDLKSVDAAFAYPADEAEFRRVFAAMVRNRVDLLDVGPTPEAYRHRDLIVKLAAEARLPAIHPSRQHVEAGGLMAYAYDEIDTFRRSASYVDLMLKGADPAELPFQQPSKFELIANLKTAKELGLAIPESILLQADKVIE